jgi:DNA-binding XRE family transcriptional regulator
MPENKVIVKKFSRRLKALRLKKRMTQEELAETADISYKNVQYLESKNPTCPSLITLSKLAKAFDLTISQLMKF